ncbi:peptidase [Lentzea sp. NBRC 105346]|uniref:leishmanolysin-related zinc metalloendopeptidase n=1 Tax=Lentzea sp. NBRC 105346 TaxID=3032205 RepID=UPI0024A5725F|nr:leishmanolysin-related zinc metalloendopeptidase [Lentzea sp. NBRC 105346]GLZ35072.1 peptidase [Lentzea sp. NBRC 105346]
MNTRIRSSGQGKIMPDIYEARADAGRALEVAATTSPFVITVRFVGGLTPSQQEAFARAADRWARLIVGDLPEVVVDGEVIDDVLILAEGAEIDGPGQILGEAGPTHVRVGGLPCKGIMRFDTADLRQMEDEGTLLDVITHEMGHVLGIGTMWEEMGLLTGVGGTDPRFTGRVAMVQYGHLRPDEQPQAVPVENDGGPGSRDSHWRESVFRTELMTSRIGGVGNAISSLTAGSLIDIGYQVDLEAAEPYQLPVVVGPAAVGQEVHGRFERPKRVEVSPAEPVA